MRFTPFVLALGLALAAPATRAFAQDAATTEKLIADLGADDVNKRDEAQRRLEALGKKALPALEKAEKDSPDAEIRARAHEAIVAIKKARGEADPDQKPEKKDEERQGPQLPPERRLAPRLPRLPQGGEQPNFDDFFKMFEGQDNDMMKALPKIFEQLKKQMDGMDREFDKELRRPRDGGRGRMRVFQFNMRSRTPAEEKLGVLVNPPPAALQAQLDLQPTDGALLVEELDPSSPAWKAGLKQYDVVLSVDGKAVRSPDDLASLGTKDAKVEIIRKAKKETLLVHAQADEPAPKPEKPAPAPEKKDEPQIRKF